MYWLTALDAAGRPSANVQAACGMRLGRRDYAPSHAGNTRNSWSVQARCRQRVCKGLQSVTPEEATCYLITVW
jgi:hypothetical protein